MVNIDLKKKDINVILGIMLVTVLYLSAVTIPISSSTKDVYIDMIVEKPSPDITNWLNNDVRFNRISATSSASTLISTPEFLGALLSSGDIMVDAEAGGKRTSQTFGTISQLGTGQFKMVLKNVPNNENLLTLKLYENMKLVQTKTVEIR